MLSKVNIIKYLEKYSVQSERFTLHKGHRTKEKSNIHIF